MLPCGEPIHFSTKLVILSFYAAKPPQIKLQPTNNNDIVPEESATFTIEAIGTDPLNYQWQWKPFGRGFEQDEWQNLTTDDNIFQQVEARLKLTSVQACHAGNYRCVVSNSAGSEISQTASLTVGKLAYSLWFECANYRQHALTVTLDSATSLLFFHIQFLSLLTS